ncbi:hypothetical protein BU16DRAFT_584714 [Lophium mytilinum]|uniref:PD-(D/E)XK nuclease-like domain-containing protein n=1 Tax=Lophium mytilinum TaxID=390894 RepID=A0A6A6QHC1_9PEZI|nr:hypothetical protein BU16DRAFT_584714 [Lophium mytilinum]
MILILNRARRKSVAKITRSLNEKNTFSPASSRVSLNPKRSSSPTRETPGILRKAWPPVLTESFTGLKETPPEHVEQLRDRLANGVDSSFIPQGLQNIIDNDPKVSHETIKPADIDRSDTRSTKELMTIWREVKEIFINARECKDESQDENAWFSHVVFPLVRLAMDLYGNDRWGFQWIKSQSINPLYLSTIPAPTLANSTRRKLIDCKSDFVFSYSSRNPSISDLYERFDAAYVHVGHTLDCFTSRIAHFSGFVLKTPSGDATEAELQMSIWIAGSLRNKSELAQAAQISYEPTAMVEPAITIVGHHHRVYYGYPRTNLVCGRSGIHVLGEDSRFGRLGTESIRGVFQLLRFYENMLEYGMDEGRDGYWGRFFGPVLNKLADIAVEKRKIWDRGWQERQRTWNEPSSD